MALVVTLWAAPWLHNAEAVAASFAAAAAEHAGVMFLSIDVHATADNRSLAFEKARTPKFMSRQLHA